MFLQCPPQHPAELQSYCITTVSMFKKTRQQAKLHLNVFSKSEVIEFTASHIEIELLLHIYLSYCFFFPFKTMISAQGCLRKWGLCINCCNRIMVASVICLPIYISSAADPSTGHNLRWFKDREKHLFSIAYPVLVLLVIRFSVLIKGVENKLHLHIELIVDKTHSP